MQNAEEVHLTGTGTSQEQLMRYMQIHHSLKIPLHRKALPKNE